MPDVVFPLLFQHRSTSKFQPLTCILILSSHQASLLLTQSRSNPLGLTLKVFFTPYLARKIFLTPHPWIFAVFLYSRTPRGKPKSIRPDVHILDSGVSSRVSALYVWPTPLLIRILASCSLSSPTLVVREIGTLTLTLSWLSSTLKKSQRSNFRLVSPLSKLFLFFLTNCFCFPDTLKSIFSFCPFHQLRYSSLLEIKLFSRLYSFPVIEVVIWGKTLRDGASNLFGMRRHPNPTLCPIGAIETYVAIARELGISLSCGYLFRSTNHQGHIVDTPLLSSTAESRSRKYLNDGQIDSRETLHSFRSGCALTLAFSGSPLADVMSHVGWSTSKTALCYLKLADLLASALPQCQEASRVYEDYNALKHFVSAFPAPTLSSSKRSLPP